VRLFSGYGINPWNRSTPVNVTDENSPLLMNADMTGAIHQCSFSVAECGEMACFFLENYAESHPTGIHARGLNA